jgi:ketosteroid isomerase-like protein
MLRTKRLARVLAAALCLLAAPAIPAQAEPRAAPATASVASPVRTAPPADPKALHALVLELDRAMFEAFNAHDVDALMSFFAHDLEFFHDKDGLLDHAAVKTGFTRVFANNPDLRRELVPGSLEVHPLPGYGALQVGRHRFCHTENGKPDCGAFSFVQVWRWSGGEWKVARELSYGH